MRLLSGAQNLFTMRISIFFFFFLVSLSLNAQLTFGLLDSNDQPIVGAATQLKLDGTLIDSQVTNEDGKVTLNPKEDGNYHIFVEHVSINPFHKVVALRQGKKLNLGDLKMTSSIYVLDPANVLAVRADDTDPYAIQNINATTLAKANTGQDVPVLLSRTVGAVASSDAGNGVGYTGLRIRGADATRVNITINGVPLNDAESQGVYWVNMPDFISSTKSIQIQRGVGSSTFGTGSFGANVNLETDIPSADPNLVGELAYGSFNTGRAMLSANSGTLYGDVRLKARASFITSDGYLDRASSRLGSVYLGAYWQPYENNVIQLIGWTGNEKTYQAWFGVPLSYTNSDSLRTYNPAGLISADSFYNNQTDNYRQTHVQYLHTIDLPNKMLVQLTGHYTKGAGYYEEYKKQQSISSYLTYPITNDFQTDLVRRLWLNNHFYGLIGSIKGKLAPSLDFVYSLGANQYRGAHYGNLIKVIDNKENYAFDSKAKYYDNDAVKTNINTFAKLNYSPIEALSLFADLQVKSIFYEFEGVDRSGKVLPQKKDFLFFNPKAGATYRLNSTSNIYSSFAIGQREPNRNDFVESPLGQQPKAESMYDVELGYRFQKRGLATFNLNGYYMIYKNQLVNTGKLNDVGELVRANASASFRRGVEAEAAINITRQIKLEGNAAFNDSRIEKMTEFVDNWDLGIQDSVIRENKPMAFSPQVITNLGLSFSPNLGAKHQLSTALWLNTVSSQYLDNSGSDAVKLPAYSTLDFEASYDFKAASSRKMAVTLRVKNILDTKFSNNGWNYRFNSPNYDPRPDDPYVSQEQNAGYISTGYYPQAGIQAMLGLRIMLGE